MLNGLACQLVAQSKSPYCTELPDCSLVEDVALARGLVYPCSDCSGRGTFDLSRKFLDVHAYVRNTMTDDVVYSHEITKEQDDACTQEQDDACLLQANDARPRRRRDDDYDDKKGKHYRKKDDDKKGKHYPKKYYKKHKKFCPDGEAELNFESFAHGAIIEPTSIRGVTITAERRRPGKPRCTGPLMVLDTTKSSPDEDLLKCENCFLMLYSHNGDQTTVADCGERPGPAITFEFGKLQDIVDIELWDNEEPTEVKLFDDDGEEILSVDAPSGPDQDGVGVTLPLFIREVRKLVVNLGGSGAIRKITACKPQGSVFGDPHIYTLDGEKFDLYESGTYSVFQYAGQKLALPQSAHAPALAPGHDEVNWQLFAHYGGKWWWAQSLLLVDHSLGRFRQAMELNSRDCQWRKKMAKDADWTPVQERGSLSLLEGGVFARTRVPFSHAL